MFIDFVGRKKPLLNNKNETTIPQGKKLEKILVGVITLQEIVINKMSIRGIDICILGLNRLNSMVLFI